MWSKTHVNNSHYSSAMMDSKVHASETKVNMLAEELKVTRGRLEESQKRIEELEAIHQTYEEQLHRSAQAESEVMDLLVAISDRNITLQKQGNDLIAKQIEIDNLLRDNGVAKLRRRKQELKNELNIAHQTIMALESKIRAYEQNAPVVHTIVHQTTRR